MPYDSVMIKLNIKPENYDECLAEIVAHGDLITVSKPLPDVALIMGHNGDPRLDYYKLVYG